MFYEVSKSVIVWIVAPDTLFGERKNRTEDQILCLQEDSFGDIYLSFISRRLQRLLPLILRRSPD